MSQPAAALPSPWSDDQLNQARLQGDAGEVFSPNSEGKQVGAGEADALAAKVLTTALSPAAGGRFDYNHLVDLADQLASDAELLLIRDSHLATCLAEYPEALQKYYGPMEAPTWLDPEKLEIASKLWHDNSLAMLGVLYASSLPACYCVANGIPALYQTEKLKDHTYIFQRIYETGMMLDAVMDPDGLHLAHDTPHLPAPLEPMLRALQQLDPKGDWKLSGEKLERSNAQAPHVKLDPEAIEECLRQCQDEADNGDDRVHDAASATSHKHQAGCRDFLWGRGYLAAKKVRLLHAAMRYMLLNPKALQSHTSTVTQQSSPGRLAQNYQGREWKTKEMGVPVNQEDLAYTLLTFSYLLPKGLEHWGCRLSLEQKEAFLHLWRVVGYVMGLRDDLMPDNMAQAEQFFQVVLKRQGRGSPNGVALTEAVADFLKTYLPSTLGLRDYVPYTLIADLMGAERAKELLAPESWARVRSLRGRLFQKGIGALLLVYYRMYSVIQLLPVTGGVFSNLFHRTTEELVQSWRDEFMRQPFYVPTDLTHWQVVRGVDQAFRERLVKWRNRVFLWVFLPVAFLGLAMPLAAATAVLLVMHRWLPSIVVGGLAGAAFVAALWGMETILPRVFRERPRAIPVREVD